MPYNGTERDRSRTEGRCDERRSFDLGRSFERRPAVPGESGRGFEPPGSASRSLKGVSGRMLANHHGRSGARYAHGGEHSRTAAFAGISARGALSVELALLDRCDVKYVVVGGFAGVLFGARRPTVDPTWCPHGRDRIWSVSLRRCDR